MADIALGEFSHSLGQSRRLSNVVGMSASPPSPDMLLRCRELSKWAISRHSRHEGSDPALETETDASIGVGYVPIGLCRYRCSIRSRSIARIPRELSSSCRTLRPRAGL